MYWKRTKAHTCIDCYSSIDEKVYHYSETEFSLPLCRSCQDAFRPRWNKSTDEAISLYVALRQRGVPAELEKFDGHKTIDIAVVKAMVNIEVDGSQHNFNANQALADLKRTFFAFKRGFLTLRIPNSLVRHHLEDTANFITEFLEESRDQLDWN